MRAIQYTRIGGEPELVDIPKPEPGPGEVLLRSPRRASATPTSSS